jgi:hypothetical protein
MNCPKTYRLSRCIAFVSISCGVALGIFVVWFPGINSYFYWKLFQSLGIVFFGSVMTMAFASVTDGPLEDTEAFD